MALASFSNRSTPSAEENELIDFLLGCPQPALNQYKHLEQSRYYNVGLEDPEFRNFRRYF